MKDTFLQIYKDELKWGYSSAISYLKNPTTTPGAIVCIIFLFIGWFVTFFTALFIYIKLNEEDYL